MPTHKSHFIPVQAPRPPGSNLDYAQAREALRRGAQLIRTNTPSQVRYSISGRGDVSASTARRILGSGDVVASDRGLFDVTGISTPQTWRWEGRRPRRDHGVGSVVLADISNDFPT